MDDTQKESSAGVRQRILEAVMNYADIKRFDVANGPGIRISLFVSGCTHACKGCFNQEAWDFNYGTPFTGNTEEKIIEYLAPEYIAGLTLLGGDPMEPSNQKALLPFIRRVKNIYPEKNIWCFTGYLFDKEILEDMCKKSDITRELISYFDVMVDGRFMIDKKDLRLKFKGSSNQRTIMVKESLRTGEIILWDGESGT